MLSFCCTPFIFTHSLHVLVSVLLDGQSTGNEEVKLASLSALASWGARCPDAIQPDVVTFIGSGLKEKDTLRRGHLRCLRVMCKSADAVVRVRKLIMFIFQIPVCGNLVGAYLT